MSRNFGVVVRGVRAPIIRPGDDLVKIVGNTIKNVVESENITLNNNDIIGITEAVVAKAQNNYATMADISEEVNQKFRDELGIVFPILSRNRFAHLLKGIAAGTKKVYIQLSYPSDEVGNHLISQDMLDDANINPYTDTLTEEEFEKIFGKSSHQWTKVDYVELYKTMCDGKATVIFSNDPKEILKYTKKVLVSDIHTRERTKRILKNAGAEVVHGLDEILAKPLNGSGYNPDYGLLGSNLATDNSVKLFPRDADVFVREVQAEIHKTLGVNLNVLVYGDGAFKDPQARIWELADPVVSPGYTDRLDGEPNELKIKYIADTKLANLEKGDAEKELANLIHNKPKTNTSYDSQGTTPRKFVDLIGSLCDLTSGSGDKGTPFILIQGYFDNFADN